MTIGSTKEEKAVVERAGDDNDDNDDNEDDDDGQPKKGRKQLTNKSLLLGGGMGSNDDEEAIPGHRFFCPRRAAVKEVERKLEEHAQRLRECHEPILTGGGRVVTSTGLLSIPRFLGGRANNASAATTQTTITTIAQQNLSPPPKNLFDNLMQGLEKSNSLL
jgi:hypothetical protein